jgi:hypothetical protein
MFGTCALVVSSIMHRCPTFNLPCTVHCVKGWGPRTVSESWGWVNWIVEHYDDKYDKVFFMHDHTSSWHRSEGAITCPSPRGFAQTPMHPPWNSNGYDELPGLTWFASTLFNTTAAKMITDHRLTEHKCCSESCTSMAIIRGTRRLTWIKIRRLIRSSPKMPWGWVLERMWPILFRLQL